MKVKCFISIGFQRDNSALTNYGHVTMLLQRKEWKILLNEEVASRIGEKSCQDILFNF